MKFLRSIILSCLVWSIAGAGMLHAQTLLLDGQAVEEVEGLKLKNLDRIRDSVRLEQILQAWSLARQEEGFVEAAIDGLDWNDGTWQAQLHLGPEYLLDSVTISSLPPEWAQQTRLERYPKKPVSLRWTQIEERLEESLELAQNEGYPFAAIEQTALRYQPDGDRMLVSADYAFRHGPEIRIDSVRFKGKKKEPDAFVRGIIRIDHGDLYNQSLVDAVPNLLNNTLYYENVSAPEVAYTAAGKAIITIPIAAKKANRFDVLAGLLPTTPGSQQRFQFTVNADVTLVSPFGQGEVIGLKFQKLPGTSQLIDLSTRLPYLFRTPLQAEGRLRIQKQEELFQNLHYDVGLIYHLTPYLQAKFSFLGTESRLLEEAIKDTSKVQPDQLDGTRRLGGVGLLFENIDYRNNPSRGWQNQVLLSIGRREVTQNVRLREVKPEWYEEVPGSQRLLEATLQLKGFFPLAERQVLHLAGYGYWLGMDQYLRTDQKQIGGVYSLRGFNENQYFADLYTQVTTEYRLQLERNSFLFGFVDLAYFEDSLDDVIRRALGTGIGMQYGTQVGILSIIYAIGVSEDQAFQPSRGRVHLGLVNEF